MTAMRSAFSILVATPIGWSLMAAALIAANAMRGAGI
jgi:hypothetical protein